MIVGRALESGKRPVFDDGDEVVREGEDGLPAEVMVGDHTGAFGEYKLPLETFAAHYARPVNTRDKVVPDPQGFATAYLDAFRDQFLHIQGDYRKRRRAFDTLFKHCTYDPAGSFAYRWECVLRRLDQTNPYALVEAIRQQIWVLNREPAKRRRPSGHSSVRHSAATQRTQTAALAELPLRDHGKGRLHRLRCLLQPFPFHHP